MIYSEMLEQLSEAEKNIVKIVGDAKVSDKVTEAWLEDKTGINHDELAEMLQRLVLWKVLRKTGNEYQPNF